MVAESSNESKNKVWKGTKTASPYRLLDLSFIILLKHFTQIYTVEEFIRFAKRSHKQDRPIQCRRMLDSSILSPSVLLNTST
jgi:hypothetical protein